jgi:hypothetical protein
MPKPRVFPAPVLALFLLLALLPCPSAAQERGGCRSDSTYARLDFWLGEWRVTVNDTLDGTDRITRILDGCAVREEWTDIDGGKGESLFYYQRATGQWKQVWVTEYAALPGGLKEKRLVARFGDGGLRFQGEIPLGDGRSILDRTTLTPLPDGTVHQVIEQSRDEGKTWRTAFDATYRHP